MLANLLPWRQQRRRQLLAQSATLWLIGLLVGYRSYLQPLQQQRHWHQQQTRRIAHLNAMISARSAQQPTTPRPPQHLTHLHHLLRLLEQSPNHITSLTTSQVHWQITGQTERLEDALWLQQRLNHATLTLHSAPSSLIFSLQGSWPHAN